MEFKPGNWNELLKLEKESVDRVLQNWEGEPLFIAFAIPLPIPLEMVHHGTIKLARGEKVPWLQGQPWEIKKGKEPVSLPGVADEGYNIVSMRVWRPRSETPPFTEPLELALRVIDSLSGKQAEQISLEADLKSAFGNKVSYPAVIEAVTPLLREDGQDKYGCVSVALDRCMEELGILTRSYSLVTGNPFVSPVSRNNVFPIIPWILQDPFSSDISGPGFLRVNKRINPSSESDQLNQQQHNAIVVCISNFKRQHPFITSSDWSMQARHAFEVDGEYTQTVVAAHTAAESLLDAVLTVTAWEDGISPEEAATWFSDGLVKRISKRYADKLKGPWQPEDTNTTVGKWVLHGNIVRHRVIHMGYHPTHSEAQRALDATFDLMEYIKDRLVIRKKKYPRTTLLLLGVSGLERRNAFTREFKNILKNIANNEDDWITSYQVWYEQFIEIVGLQ